MAEKSRRILVGYGGSFISERTFKPSAASHAAFFPILLAGKAQAHAGYGLEPCFGDRFAAFTAAGLTVYPFRPFLKSSGTHLTQSGFAFYSFQLRCLIENIHSFS